MLFDFKKMWNIALAPKKLKAVKADGKTGLEKILLYAIALAVINVIVMSFIAVIDQKDVGFALSFSATSAVSVVIMTVVGLLITSVVAALITKAFKGTGNYQTTLGLVGYAIIPIFVVGVVWNALLLISALMGHALAGVFTYISLLLLLVSLVWTVYVGTFAVAYANKVKPSLAVLGFVIGYVIAILVNIFVLGGLGKISATVLTAMGIL